MDEIEPPDFLERSQNPEYRQAIAELAELFQKKALPIAKLSGGFYFEIEPKKFPDANQIETLQTEFLQRGCFLFSSDFNFKKISSANLVLITFPTTSKIEAIAVMGSQGCLYECCIGAFVKWLGKLAEAQTFVLTAIGFNHLNFRFLTPIKNPIQLATEMADFAPEMMLQGEINSIEELAESLQTNDQHCLWWD